MKITIEVSSKEVADVIRDAIRDKGAEADCSAADYRTMLGSVSEFHLSPRRKDRLTDYYRRRQEESDRLSEELFEIGQSINEQVKEAAQ